MSPEEFRDLQDRILYEDNHLLIFNKRTGEIVQGDKTGDEPLSETLKAFIAQRDGKPGQVFMGVPHRLDRPVSGVVLFAKTSKARTAITSWKWSSTPTATTRSVASWPTWAVPSKETSNTGQNAPIRTAASACWPAGYNSSTPSKRPRWM